jgi:hypothetical protein
MHLAELKNFSFEGNTFAFPPSDVMMQDMKVVYKFLRGEYDATCFTALGS